MRFLELEATFAGCVGECFYFAVITCAAAVEDDRGNARGLRFGGESNTEGFRPGEIGGRLLLAKFGVKRAEKYKRCTSVVIDRLCIDMLRREAHGETRTEGGASDFFADSPTAFLKEF